MPRIANEPAYPVKDYFIQDNPNNTGLTEVITIGKERDSVSNQITNKVRSRIYVQFGTTVEEAVALYGAKVVFDCYIAQAKVTVQNRCRKVMAQGGSIKDLAATWFLPSVKEKTAMNSIKAAISAASPQKQWELQVGVLCAGGFDFAFAVKAVTEKKGDYPGTDAEFEAFKQELFSDSEEDED